MAVEINEAGGGVPLVCKYLKFLTKELIPTNAVLFLCMTYVQKDSTE